MPELGRPRVAPQAQSEGTAAASPSRLRPTWAGLGLLARGWGVWGKGSRGVFGVYALGFGK